MGDDRDLRTRVDALSLKIFNLHLYRKKNLRDTVFDRLFYEWECITFQ